MLSIAEGVTATMKASGDPDLVLILRAGSDTEMTSGLAGDAVRDHPGRARHRPRRVRRATDLAGAVRRRRSSAEAVRAAPRNVPLRGVTPEAFKVHDRLKIVEGRNFEFGKNEIIAGRAAARQFVGLNVGTTLKWGESSWTLVGIFDDGGSVSESELWCDVKVLQPAYRRGNSYQSVYARLASHRFVPAAEGLADVEPAADRLGDARARLLRQPDRDAAADHPHDWRHHRAC